MGKNNHITHRSACLNDTLLVEPGTLESRSNQRRCGFLHLYVLDQRLSLSLCKNVCREENNADMTDVTGGDRVQALFTPHVQTATP